MSQQDQNEEQSFSQQQDSQCIELKQKIYLKTSQMHILINDRQKFLMAISNLLNSANKKVEINQKQQLKFALIYLKEAERLVEYAASCGKNISKQLIIHILHNQASIYQKLWQLIDCSNYLQGIIYNYQQFIKESSICTNETILIKEESILNKEPNMIRMKQQLCRYNIQLCAINSQLANHQDSLIAIKKSSRLIVHCIKGTIQQFKRQLSWHYSQSEQKTILRLSLLLALAEYQKKIENTNDYNQLYQIMLKGTHFCLQLWQQQKSNAINKSNKDATTKDYIDCLNSYSIGNIVEIIVLKFEQSEIGIFSIVKDKLDQSNIDKEYHIHKKIILLSAVFFSRATQLRLKSLQIYKNRPQDRKSSKQFKLSINFHLLALMIISISIPYQVKYMNQIMSSFHKHYNIKLAEYKTVQSQSILKIIEILNIDIQQYVDLLRPYKQLRTIDLKQSNMQQHDNDYNLKSNFEIDKHKKTQKLKKLKKLTNQLISPGKQINNRTSNSKQKYFNKSKQYMTNISIKTDSKDNVCESKLKKSPSFSNKFQIIKDKKNSNYVSKQKISNLQNQHRRSQKDTKKNHSKNKPQKKSESKSKSKAVVDETEQLFFCFTKKTKKSSGLGVQVTPGNNRADFNRQSSVNSKNSNKNTVVNTPRSNKIQTLLSPKRPKQKSPKNAKERAKRRNVGQVYYNF